MCRIDAYVSLGFSLLLCQEDVGNLAQKLLVVLGALVDLLLLLWLLVDLFVRAESVVSPLLNECVLRSRCQDLLLLLLQCVLCCQCRIAFRRCVLLALGALVPMHQFFHDLVLISQLIHLFHQFDSCIFQILPQTDTHSFKTTQSSLT